MKQPRRETTTPPQDMVCCSSLVTTCFPTHVSARLSFIFQGIVVKICDFFADEPGILCFAVLLESHSWLSIIGTFLIPFDETYCKSLTFDQQVVTFRKIECDLFGFMDFLQDFTNRGFPSDLFGCAQLPIGLQVWNPAWPAIPITVRETQRPQRDRLKTFSAFW